MQWILHKPMDLNFEIFMIVLLVLSIVVVGNFLRDGESNALEGGLLVVSRYSRTYYSNELTGFRQIVYLIIAIAAWYYPDPDVAKSNGGAYIAQAVAKELRLQMQG
jgi:Ca2+:H+ antiporter